MKDIFQNVFYIDVNAIGVAISCTFSDEIFKIWPRRLLIFSIVIIDYEDTRSNTANMSATSHVSFVYNFFYFFPNLWNEVSNLHPHTRFYYKDFPLYWIN